MPPPPPPKGGSKGGWPMPPQGGSKGGWPMPPPPPKGGSGTKGGGWPMPPPQGESKGGWPMPPPGGKGSMPPPPGKGGSPSGKGAPSYCTSIPVVLFKTDLASDYFTTSVGFGYNQVPFFNPANGQQLGTFSQTVTTIPNSTECIGTSAYSFDYDSTLQLYHSQINTASTCDGQMNAITGGSGTYGCASGYDVFQYENTEVYATNLYICQALCPYVFKIGMPNPTSWGPPTMAPAPVAAPTMVPPTMPQQPPPPPPPTGPGIVPPMPTGPGVVPTMPTGPGGAPPPV